MPVTLVPIDEWCPLIVTEHRLCDLAGEGLLRPVTSSTQLEWITLLAEDRELNPIGGYVVNFVKFHHHVFGSPLSRFMRALIHYYGAKL
jgi:hypothetical protein